MKIKESNERYKVHKTKRVLTAVQSGLSLHSNLILLSSLVAETEFFIARSFISEFKSIRALSVAFVGVGKIDELIISSRVLGPAEETPAGVNPNADGEKKGLSSENGVKFIGVFLRTKSLGEPLF